MGQFVYFQTQPFKYIKMSEAWGTFGNQVDFRVKSCVFCHHDINEIAPGFHGGCYCPANGHKECLSPISGLYPFLKNVPDIGERNSLCLFGGQLHPMWTWWVKIGSIEIA
jgi:hypothetical protein